MVEEDSTVFYEEIDGVVEETKIATPKASKQTYSVVFNPSEFVVNETTGNCEINYF